jgi:hypothetical protein
MKLGIDPNVSPNNVKRTEVINAQDDHYSMHRF